MISLSLVFTLISSTISLSPSLVYPIESPIWKGETGVLACVKSLLNLSDGLTRGLYNLCETAYLITSSSTSWEKSIGLPVVESSLVHTDARSKMS